MADLLERELGQTLVTSLPSSAVVACHQNTVTGVLIRGAGLDDLVKTAFCFCLRRRGLQSNENKVVGVASRSRRTLNHKAWARALVVIALRFDLLTTPSISFWFSLDRGTQREILRKRPKHNNKAWEKLSKAILSNCGVCWKKFIYSSLQARLMEEFPASKVHIQPATRLTGKFPSIHIMSRHYWPVFLSA